MIIEAPLVPEPVEGGVKGEGIMRAINASLERIIRQYPEQWLWFHDRWRSARQRGLIEAPPLEY
jgi:KDO2-lipid IV(A) lauroyltransferase